MRTHIFTALLVGLCSWSFAQTLPQSNLEAALEKKAQAAQKANEGSAMFGSVEALWQYTRKPSHRRHLPPKPLTTRTHATAVRSGELVFIHTTPFFAPDGFAKDPKLLQLTFTALDGTKVILKPSYQKLKRHWVVARVNNLAN